MVTSDSVVYIIYACMVALCMSREQSIKVISVNVRPTEL